MGDLVGIYDGVHQTPEYQDSGIMFLSVENIATLKSEKYISKEAFERDYKVYPEKGDILMTRIGDVGTTNVVETAKKVAFYVSLALLKPNGINSYFLSNAMKTNAFQKGLRERTLVTAIPQKINKDEIGKIDIFITNNDVEQQKIGAYFSTLDHLITLHQRKYLQKKKTSLTWEQRKVSEIAIEKLSNGIMNNQSDGETGVKHINVINMYDTDKIHPEKLAFSNYEEDAVKKCNVEFGDIFLTRSSLKPEGIAEANVLLNSGRFVYDDHLIRVKVNKEKYDPFFVKLNLSGNAFKRQFIVRAKTTAFTTIGQEDISECLGSFPKKEEQQQIGECFMVIDHLITLHRRAHFHRRRRTYK